MIEINNISKAFAGTVVLKDISFRFHPGKVNIIIGQSGSGKSVLTKCIVGLHQPDQGSVIYDGENFTAMNRIKKRNIRKQIGMLFQGSALFDSLTVEQNVMFPLTMFTNMTRDEMRDRANFCLQKVKLENKNHLYPSETSGGMQKRIAIARAIAMNPKYLFCDEPNSGLDPKTAIVIDNLIQDITNEFNTTTIVITHDMNSVMEIGDNIMFLYMGENWWQGDKHAIITTDNKEVNEFVYASEFMKGLKSIMQKGMR
jgi:phospholipid/cholesterol/gamma-HCH transport system ATP-binding protein